MKFIFYISLLLNTFVICAQSGFDKMTNEKMNKVLLREASEVKGGLGSWEATFQDIRITVLTSAEHNRMRIVAPVLKTEKLTKEDYKLIMEANFDKALDAKYAVYNDILWASFTHPLGELTVEQFKDAMLQVVTLVRNYGTSYSSTHLVFGGAE